MVKRSIEALQELYETDETAWLEEMSKLAATGRPEDLDCVHLSEYLADMAKRDKREVMSRLAVLIAHLLKWQYQADKRAPSWRLTIEVQRQELAELLESGTLREYATNNLAQAYTKGTGQAHAETGLAVSEFPADCPFSLDQLLAPDYGV